MGTCVPRNAVGNLSAGACPALSVLQRWGGLGRVSRDPPRQGADANRRGGAMSGLCRWHFGAVCTTECAMALPENVVRVLGEKHDCVTVMFALPEGECSEANPQRGGDSGGDGGAGCGIVMPFDANVLLSCPKWPAFANSFSALNRLVSPGMGFVVRLSRDCCLWDPAPASRCCQGKGPAVGIRSWDLQGVWASGSFPCQGNIRDPSAFRHRCVGSPELRRSSLAGT